MSEVGRFLERFDFREEYLASREIKAEKILRILKEELLDLRSCSLLDIGCSQGHITGRIAREFQFVVGIDRDWEPDNRGKGFHFVQADGCNLPIRSSCVDVVLLNHVLEHVLSSEKLLKEVWRVLKPHGLTYLACPNRYSLMEPHYRLPFLSWFPRRLADLYVRLAGRGNRYVDQLPSYWQLRRWTRRFLTKDQTVPLLRNPNRFFSDDPKLMGQLRHVGWIPDFLWKLVLPWLPVWVVVLRKPAVETFSFPSPANQSEESFVQPR